MACIHVWLERSKDYHFAVHSLDVLHFFNHNWDGPNPISIDKEESVQKLEARIVGIELTNLS